MSRILFGLGAFLFVCLLGVAGYVWAGWSVLDAVYMVIITIFGVGYGEVNAVDTPALRSFTIGVIVAGYGAAVYAAGGFIQLITGGEIQRALGARRMSAGIGNLQEHVIVCGFGRMGRILALELTEARSELVVVDANEDKVRDARAIGLLAVLGDATREEVLTEAGVERARVLATVLPQDALNVFVTLTASGLAPQLRILARAEDPSAEAKLLRSGAAEVVLPAASGARRLSNLVTQPDVAAMLEKVDGTGSLAHELGRIGLSLEELVVPDGSRLAGCRLDELETGCLVLAVRHADGMTLVNPPGETALREGDAVIVVGHEDDLPELKARSELRRERFYRGVRYEP